MKKQILIASLLASSAVGINVANAANITFSSTAGAGLVSENTGTTSGSVAYNSALWVPGGVNSATLTLLLSDDVSTILGTPYATIDIPRETAELSSISNGNTSIAGSSTAEVQQTSALFDPSYVFPFDDNTFAGHDGFENPLTGAITNASLTEAAIFGTNLITSSSTGYFDIDVTTLLNDIGGTGTLSFDLLAQNLFGPAALPPAFLAAIAPFGFDPLNPQTTFEDFNYIGAELAVDYVAVPAPTVILMLASGLLGLVASKKSFKQKV